MRVLMVAPVPFFVDRGTPMRILEEALALERKGVNVDIVTYHLGRNISAIDNKSRIKVYRIARLLFWYNKKEAGADWQKIPLDILLIWKTAKIVFLKRPTIIHAHLHEGVLIGWLVKKIFFWRNIKLVADFHGELVSEMESHGYLQGGIIKRIFHFLENFIFKLGDFTLTSSVELRSRVAKILKNKNIEVVLDGVDIKRYDVVVDKKNDDGLTFIYSGAFVSNKGIDILLEAILKIAEKKISGVRFILAGGPLANIENFINNNRLNDLIQIISPLEYFDLPKVNKLGDIAIDPKTSAVGQASGKILQYMAAELPVICFDRENNRQYLGGSGYYVKDFNATGLYEAIIYFTKNKDKMIPMSRIAKEKIDNFTWDASAQKIINIYKELK